MFLLEYAPGVLDDLCRDLKLFTIKSECKYLAEITAFDEVSVRMRLEDLTQTQIGFVFDYVRVRDGLEELIARSSQRVACMRGSSGSTTSTRVPEELRRALESYEIRIPQQLKVAGTGGRA